MNWLRQAFLCLLAVFAVYCMLCACGCATVRADVQWQVSQADGPDASVMLVLTADLD